MLQWPTVKPFYKQVLLRPSPTPVVTQPLNLRSVGRARIAPGMWEDNAVRNHARVVWYVEGIGSAVFDHKTFPLRAGEVSLHLPATRHAIRAGNQPLLMHWLSLDGKMASEVLSGFGLRREGVYAAGNCPATLFERLEATVLQTSAQGEVAAALLAYRILARLAEAEAGATARDRRIETALRIIARRWNDPELSVNGLADDLGMHRSSFSRRFHQHCGRSPGAYLLDRRLQGAADLLLLSDSPIAEVGALCGFTDPAYFSRAFARRCGEAPRAFRGRVQASG